MKWTLISTILFYSISTAQTVDTLTNAKAYASALELQLTAGVTTEGHPYVYASKQNPGTNAQIVKFDLTNKHITIKDFSNNQQGIGWRGVMDSSGHIFTTRGTGTREVYELNLKIPDSIWYNNLHNSSLTGLGFAYTYGLGRNKSMGIGNSSSPASTDFAIKFFDEDTLRRFPELDSVNGYTYHCFMDIDGWVYAQTGQGYYAIYAYNTSTGQKKRLLRRDEVFMDLAAYRNGIFAYRNDSAKQYLLTGGDTILVPNNYDKGTNIFYNETEQYASSGGRPLVNSFYDAAKNYLYYRINSTFDSIQFDGGRISKNIGIMQADKYNTNRIVFVGNPYGYIHEYYIAEDSVVTYGFPGFNVYSMYQLNDSIWYLSGYPSGICVKWNRNQYFTAESWRNGAYAPVSYTTNPKLMGYWAGSAGFDHAHDLTLVSGKYLCATGNNIRDKFTSSVGAVDIAKDSIYGYSDDKMISKSYIDIEAYGNKLMYSTSNANGGKPYLYVYDPVTNTLSDSLDFGFKNYGFIFIFGERLYGIAVDTANVYQTIDTTRFYIVNLSTRQIVYNKKYVGTVNTAQLMPDGRIGINFTRRTNPAAPLTDALLPNDFFNLRRIDNRTYNFNGIDKYFGISGQDVIQYSGITNEVIDASTAQGKEQILINWLH